jgi:hypothetical protein
MLVSMGVVVLQCHHQETTISKAKQDVSSEKIRTTFSADFSEVAYKVLEKAFCQPTLAEICPERSIESAQTSVGVDGPNDVRINQQDG